MGMFNSYPQKVNLSKTYPATTGILTIYSHDYKSWKYCIKCVSQSLFGQIAAVFRRNISAKSI